MTLFGLAMDQVFACDGTGIQFGSMGYLSCRAAAFLNIFLHRTPQLLAPVKICLGRAPGFLTVTHCIKIPPIERKRNHVNQHHPTSPRAAYDA
jgi:hypothetical protein